MLLKSLPAAATGLLVDGASRQPSCLQLASPTIAVGTPKGRALLPVQPAKRPSCKNCGYTGVWVIFPFSQGKSCFGVALVQLGQTSGCDGAGATLEGPLPLGWMGWVYEGNTRREMQC